jgi:hypothetical protein
VLVVLVFTKFDQFVSQVLFDIAGGDRQHHERARVRAQGMYEASRHRLLRKHPKDVPVEIVSSICSSSIRCVGGLFDTFGWSQRTQNMVILSTT